MENLKTHPSVASRLAAGEVEIEGWVYDIGSGSGWEVDPESGEFEKVEACTGALSDAAGEKGGGRSRASGVMKDPDSVAGMSI